MSRDALPRRGLRPCMRVAGILVVAALALGCAGQNRPLQLVGGAGPLYPPAAREAGVEGFVTIRYDVDDRGRVVNAAVIASEPENVFDAAALEAVRSWRFNPVMRDGRPEFALDRESTVTFRLGDASEYDRY